MTHYQISRFLKSKFYFDVKAKIFLQIYTNKTRKKYTNIDFESVDSSYILKSKFYFDVKAKIFFTNIFSQNSVKNHGHKLKTFGYSYRWFFRIFTQLISS